MKALRLGNGTIVFLLFFGIGLLEAFRNGKWLEAVFWVAIGVGFAMMDAASHEGRH